MSYDLAVFAPRALSSVDLRALVEASSGLHAGDTVAKSIEVVRGARQRYCFTIEGPDQVEAEDVPTEIASVVLGSRCLYTVTVEGSADSEIPHAVRFARRLAQALDGALINQQSDEVWSKSKSRVIQRPSRESRVATVDVDWFCLRRDLNHDVPRRFIEAVAQHLPEALPRRFGEYEPLQGKYAEGGCEAFVAAWNDATSLLFFSGSGPCIGGSLAAGPSEQFPDRFWSMSLTFLAEPLRVPGWRDALRHVFTTLTDSLPAFYATAAVTRDHIWSGRSLWSDGDTEWSIRPLRYRDGWMGLTPTPTWWTWLGSPYRDLADRLPSDRTTSTERGALFEASIEPTAVDSLEGLDRWLPSDFFATLGPNPHRQQPIPLVRAKAIPDPLA